MHLAAICSPEPVRETELLWTICAAELRLISAGASQKACVPVVPAVCQFSGLVRTRSFLGDSRRPQGRAGPIRSVRAWSRRRAWRVRRGSLSRAVRTRIPSRAQQAELPTGFASPPAAARRHPEPAGTAEGPEAGSSASEEFRGALRIRLRNCLA